MTIHHASECAFSVSFGDEGCDCDGPETPLKTDEERLAVAKDHLARARAALNHQTRRQV